MKKYVYDESANISALDNIVATFAFTDVDGNCVEGKYSYSNILDLMERLGSFMTEKFHPTLNEPQCWANGIIDISKPVTITILKREPEI